MGADVPETAALLAPRGCSERVVRCEDRADLIDPGLQPAAGRDRRADELVDLRHEAPGEEDRRGDIALGDRRDDLGRLLVRERHRLVQQQVPARPGGPQRDRGLHVRRQRDRHRVHVPDQLVDLRVRLRPVCRGQLGRLVGITPPDPD
jgi:hypothetical protein